MKRIRKDKFPTLSLLLLCFYCFGTCMTAAQWPGEFTAGTFVLTQDALDEAPHRHTEWLLKAFDELQKKFTVGPMIHKKRCGSGYYIFPIGRPEIAVDEKSIRLTLQENNTIHINLRVRAQMSARASFSAARWYFLCIRFTLCRGTISGYSDMSIQIPIQVQWLKVEKRLRLSLKNIQSEYHSLIVHGCRNTFFGNFAEVFTNFKRRIQNTISTKIKDYLNSFGHNYDAPEVFSPMKNTEIRYRISGIVWTKEYVLFKARGVFIANVKSQTLRYMPKASSVPDHDLIPMSGWNLTSAKDEKSHLLQGIRVSTEFLNAVMWYVTITDKTTYEGGSQILDTRIETKVGYAPPINQVNEDNVLTVRIKHGIVQTNCSLAEGNVPNNPKTLLGIEFQELYSSGSVSLDARSSRTRAGITLRLKNFDFSKFRTKPFEPKLPIPVAIEQELMQSAIKQMRPFINKELEHRPLRLSQRLSPFLAEPVLNLKATRNGNGYVEIQSYCTCQATANTLYSQCELSSGICSPTKDRSSSRIEYLPEDVPEAPSSDGPAFETFKTNFSSLYLRQLDSLYTGTYLSLFVDSDKCQLSDPGDTVQVYWLWRTRLCTPLYFGSGESEPFYYMLDDHQLYFGCSNSTCQGCQFDLQLPEHDYACTEASTGESLYLGPPDIHSWEETAEKKYPSLVVNAFLEKSCEYQPSYLTPHLISTHTRLGAENKLGCQVALSTEEYFISRFTLAEDSPIVDAAAWLCQEANCTGCATTVEKRPLKECFQLDAGGLAVFTATVPYNLSNKTLGVAVVSTMAGLIAVAFIVLVIVKMRSKLGKFALPVGIFFWRTLTMPSYSNFNLPAIRISYGVIRQLLPKPRWTSWDTNNREEIWNDLTQNGLLIANGIAAIAFASLWNRNINPLLIIENEIRSSMSFNTSMFESGPANAFIANLNMWIVIVNAGNAIIAFSLVALWALTSYGQRRLWMTIRLFSSLSMLIAIFVVIIAALFSTNVDELVALLRIKGNAITGNESMFSIASDVLKLFLNCLSLMVVSFTVLFIFHGVGGGIFCGALIYKALHIQTPKSTIEIISGLLVLLTIVQPLICLLPLLIWSQQASDSYVFLTMYMLNWTLPVLLHLASKVLNLCRRSIAANLMLSIVYNRIVVLLQLVGYIVAFYNISEYMSEHEFGEKHKNVREFISPVKWIIFVWMASTSYLILSLVDNPEQNFPNQIYRNVLPAIATATPSLPIEMSTRRSISPARGPEQEDLFSGMSVRERARMIDMERVQLRSKRNVASSQEPAVEPITGGQEVQTTTGTKSEASKPPIAKKPSIRSESEAPAQPVPKKPVPPAVPKKPVPPPVAKKPVSPIEPKQPVPPPVAKKPAPSASHERLAPSAVPGNIVPPSDSERANTPAEREVAASPAVPEQQVPPPVPTKPALPPVAKRLSLKERGSSTLSRVFNSMEDLRHQRRYTSMSNMNSETSRSCCHCLWAPFRKLFNIILERKEYKDPLVYGWRIKYRRLFLVLGTCFFSHVTFANILSAEKFSAKIEMQNLLTLADVNLTWPDTETAFDDVFGLFNYAQSMKENVMMGSVLAFWTSVICDLMSSMTEHDQVRPYFLMASRVTNVVGSLIVFLSVVIVGLPDYIEATHLQDLIPFCGTKFNKMFLQIGRFAIGMAFAGVFTLNLSMTLIAIGPALVRASVLILIHPFFGQECETAASAPRRSTFVLQPRVLKKMIPVSGLLTLPITMISAIVLQQYKKDLVFTLLIVSFWLLPPVALFIGLHLIKSNKHLLIVYYAYNVVYVASLLAMLLYSFHLEAMFDFLSNYVQKATFWTGFVGQIILCNVVISDVLYMSLF